MTPAQTALVKAAILADGTLAPLTSGPGTDYVGIMNAMNAPSTTTAWRTSVPPQDMDEAADYTVFDSIAAGKRDSWGYLIGFNRDFTRNKIRKWITDVWGNATAGSSAESILQAGTEKASKAEVAIGGTVKTTGTVSAIQRDWAGQIQLSDVVGMFHA